MITAAVQYYNEALIIRGELINRSQDKLHISKKAKRPIWNLGLANSHTKHSVGNSSFSVRFVSTKWANGIFLFDYMGQWELLI